MWTGGRNVECEMVVRRGVGRDNEGVCNSKVSRQEKEGKKMIKKTALMKKNIKKRKKSKNNIQL